MSQEIGWRQRFATRVAFLVSGLGMAAWAPLVPFVKARLQLDSAHLGLMLLCLGIGAILAMPFAGVLTSRYGCRAVVILAAVLECATLPTLSITTHVATAVPM